MLVIIKKIYRLAKWSLIVLISFGKSTKTVSVDVASIYYGQTPGSQFSAKSTYRFLRGGDWDKELLPVEEHVLYRSYVDHFVKNIPWEDTPFFTKAVKEMESGIAFRGEYADLVSLKQRFKKCEQLYNEIATNGYKSNKELYQEGKIKSRLFLLDEVTVNITREGELVLNDGWHRFVSARLTGLKYIPVRILVRHSGAPKKTGL